MRAAADPAARLHHDEAVLEMSAPVTTIVGTAPAAEASSRFRSFSWREVALEAKLLLVGIPVALWTLIPIYHLFLFAISPKEQAFSGQLWPANPTLRNFEVVFGQKHYFLIHFWQQLWNSLVIAVATGLLTLAIATLAAFAISRLKVKGGRTVMNLALFTYFIPAAFLAVPMYRTMGIYGLLNNRWSLILAMVTIAAPYSIWVLKQASDKLPLELDEAAVMDGASPLQLFRLVYLPLMMPSLVAIGTYALLLAWNEYLYAFLLLSRDTDITLPVALGNFLAADDSPWELLMTTGLIYALPPAAIYYAFRRYMVSGLTAGAVKS
jgi:multiple sugar transport system permease protein